MFKSFSFFAVLVSLLFIFPAFVSAQNVLIDGVCVPGVGDPDCGPSNPSDSDDDSPTDSGDPTPPGAFTPLDNPISGNIDTIPKFVNAILSIVVTVAAPIVVFCLVYAGFLFVTARGNETSLERAKKVFFWTIIGGLVILGANLLSSVIGDTINQLRP